jgi:hypothetical protein
VTARGRCPKCRYRWPLRKDGTLGHHWLYAGNDRHECDGAGSAPVEFDPPRRRR